MNSRIVIGLGFVLVVGLVPVGSSMAAAEEAAPDPDLQAAKAEFEAAQTLFIKEQFEEAANHFLGAYARKQFPAFLFNAAVSYEKVPKLEKAAEFFQKYLVEDPKAADAATVKVRIEALKTILAPPAPVPPATPPVPPVAPPGTPGAGAAPGTGTPAAPGTAGAPGAPAAPAAPPAGGPAGPPPVVLTPPAPALPAIETKGLVVIDSKPPGATIYLDTKTNGVFAKTPWQGSLPSKPVKLILEAKGFKPEERNIGPRSDKLVDVYIALSEEHFLGWVEIVSNVPGAQVFIDRKDIGAIGRTPFTGHLKPGKHKIFLERMGFKPTEREIEVLPGTATQHMIKLDQGDNGWINVAGRGSYGATVSIDKKFACNVPCRTEVVPGVHRVLVQKAGSEDYQADLRVDRVTETTLEIQWSPRPSKRTAWTTAGLAAGFVGGGLYVGYLSNKNRDAVRSDIASGIAIDSSDPRYSRGKWEAIGADVLYGIGAILAISATVSFLSHGPDSTAIVDQKPIAFGPSIAPDGVGLVAWGRF